MNQIFMAGLRAAPTAHLNRLAAVAAKKMKAGERLWGDIWLVVEGELVARSIWG